MKKTNKRLLAVGGIFCAVGILFFGVGVASGGRNYIKSADLNRISGTATMDSSDSHAILSKTKLDAFSAVNIDLRNLDLDVKESDDKNFIFLIILKRMTECFRFPIRYRMIH